MSPILIFFYGAIAFGIMNVLGNTSNFIVWVVAQALASPVKFSGSVDICGTKRLYIPMA